MTAPLPQFEIQAVAPRQETWTLTLEPDALTFADPKADTPVSVPRHECPERISFREHRSWINGLKRLLGLPNLEAKLPNSTYFKVPPDALAALSQWRGPPTPADLQAALRRRIGWLWTVPLGVLLILASLPLPDPATGAIAVPVDVVGMLLGLLLLALPVLRALWPRPVLFLLLALWFAGIGVDLTVDVVRGKSSVYWLLLLPLLLLIAAQAFTDFLSFRRVSNTPGSPP
jgi:hypothetical protein